METGVSDAAVDAAVARRLLEAAAPLAALLGDPARWKAAAGVRAATADGLPLVGVGAAANVILAVGARRNGWLLAPLIAHVVLDAVEGRAPAGRRGAFRSAPALWGQVEADRDAHAGAVDRRAVAQLRPQLEVGRELPGGVAEAEPFRRLLRHLAAPHRAARRDRAGQRRRAEAFRSSAACG